MEKGKFLNYEQSKMIKGMAAIMICVSHIINDRYSSMIQFLRYGSLWVGIFLFFTGYGLLSSYKNKKDYLENFIKKKILKIYLPMVMAEILYLIIYKVGFNYNFTIKEIIWGILGIKLVNTALWYVQFIIIVNLIFYVLYKYNFIKRKILFINLMYILYMATMIILDKIVGIDTWWYLSTSCLILGFNTAEYKEKINEMMRKLQKIKILNCIELIVTIGGLILINIVTVSGSNIFAINKNYSLIFIELLLCPIFTLTLLSIFNTYNFQSKILLFLGNISMEIYFYHRLAIKIMIEKFKVSEGVFQVLLIMFLAIILGFIMNKFDCFILKKVKKCMFNEEG